MSAFTDKVRELVTELKTEIENANHAVSDRAHAIFAKLLGDEQQLATEATADVRQVETDAAPIVAEAKTDAEHLASEAVTDAKDATAPAAPVEPPATPTA